MRFVVEELYAEPRLCLGRFRHDKQTARVFVDAVDKTHFGVVGIEARVVFQVPCHGVDERAVEVAGSRVHHHAGGLVDDHQRIVFIDDVERNVLGLDGGVVARAVEHERDDVARAHLVVALHGALVHVDEARVGSLLDAVARGVLHFLLHVFVDAQRRLPRIDLEAEVFVQLLRVQLVNVALVHGFRFQTRPLCRGCRFRDRWGRCS